MTTNSTQTFLSLKNLHKSYNGAVAIDHLSLDIRQGEFMTFLGPSGSGKSTTLYITAGFENPTSGQVLLGGRDLLGEGPAQRNIGMVFQRYTLFPHMSVAENVAFPLRVRKMSATDVQDRVEKMLKLVHLHDFGHRKPIELSGGQQQRVAIARALAYDPPILLMDEPLSALDKKLREELQMELRRIHQETGVTILYVTHDQEEALRLSDRIAVFNKGCIEQVGTGPELYERPRTEFVAGFIGNSNFIQVNVQSFTTDSAVVRLPDGTALACAYVGNSIRSERGQLMVRPESLRLKAAGATDVTCSSEVTVLTRSYLGESIQFSVLTPWQQELEVRMGPIEARDANCNLGDKARIIWDERHSVCYPEHTS
jgi:putative spermidine/putrescine transport system ATP-binding protein